MAVIFSKSKNRLAWRAGKTGLLRADAVDQAEANIEQLREPTIDYIDENLNLLSLLYSQTEGAESAPYGALYDASNAIAGTAPLFGLDALGSGAFSLCELLAHLEHEKTWNAPALKVFIDGLSIMRQFHPAISSNESKLILDNLAILMAHIVESGAGNREA